MATPQLTDERLAWLAVRDQVREMSKPGGIGALLGVLKFMLAGGSRRGEAEEEMNDKMKKYAIAVDDLSRRLTREDRLVLRSTGAVPPWFLDAVIVEASNIRLPY